MAFDFNDIEKLLSDFDESCRQSINNNIPIFLKGTKTAATNREYLEKKNNAQLKAKEVGEEILNDCDRQNIDKETKNKLSKKMWERLAKIPAEFDLKYKR